MERLKKKSKGRETPDRKQGFIDKSPISGDGRLSQVAINKKQESRIVRVQLTEGWKLSNNHIMIVKLMTIAKQFNSN